MRRFLALLGTATIALGVSATAASACGFLVAPNGSVRLQRTTTLAAYHNGVEHYVTSFEFASDAPEFGSIIPLPGKPTKVERAGDWTLQRLEREVSPVLAEADVAFRAASPTSGVAVISRTQIGALTVTVVRGGGADVAKWAQHNGFALPADTPAALEFYSRRSPYFALAKFDARRAVSKGLTTGDGIPVHIVMPLANPWVPLRILGAAKPADEIVQADVFLLTDRKPTLLTGAGLVLGRSEPASSALLDDLRSDKHSSWVPRHAWFTFVRVDERAADLSYDLAIDASGHSNPSVIDTGIVTFAEAHNLRTVSAPTTPASYAWALWVLAAVALFGVLGLGTWAMTRRPAFAPTAH